MDPDRPHEPLLDFAAPLERLRRLLPLLVALALLGGVAEAALDGLSVGLVVRWLTVAAVLAVGVLAVLAAAHALGGADRAQQRGERLAGDDVRIRPALPRRDPRRERDERQAGQDPRDR